MLMAAPAAGDEPIDSGCPQPRRGTKRTTQMVSRALARSRQRTIPVPSAATASRGGVSAGVPAAGCKRWARPQPLPGTKWAPQTRKASSSEASHQTARALRLPGNAVRVHYDVDVGGSYGVKRGLKHTVLVGYLAKRLGLWTEALGES